MPLKFCANVAEGDITADRMYEIGEVVSISSSCCRDCREMPLKVCISAAEGDITADRVDEFEETSLEFLIPPSTVATQQ